MAELDPQLRAEIAQKGRDSLFFLARAILGFDRLNVEIHKSLCDRLQDYKVNTRVMTVLPRGWYKSTICTIAYPIWRAIQNPEVRILLVQNTYTNACGKLGAIKQIFESNDLFRALYPEILPNNDCIWSKDAAIVKRKGAYPEATWEAAGTGTQKTGQHYDLIIEDDTVSPDKDNLTGSMMIPTQNEIEKAIGWFKLGTPLLIEPLDSQRVVVGTRWTESDLLGFILEHHPEYNVETRAVRENSLGQPDPEGEIQWPARFDETVLKSLQVDLGPYMYSALYMNCPTSASNQVFKREWINYYQNLPDSKRLLYCTSVDLACADKEESSDPDYNVVLTTALDTYTGNVYVVYYNRERTSPSGVINRIFDHYRAYKPAKTIIEGIGYQRTIKHWLEQKQRKLGLAFWVDIITSHKGSKVDRVRGLQPYFAATKIFMQAGMSELERELLTFPKGGHDDLVDALSMQLDFWNTSTTLINQDKGERIGRSPFAVDVLMNEIKARHSLVSSYPHDMGTMKYRLPRHIDKTSRRYSRGSRLSHQR